MVSVEETWAMLSEIKFRDWSFDLGWGGENLWLRVAFDAKCAQTGKEQTWTGRKFLLSKHMTRSEVVQTAWLAVQTALMHEARETFTYRGRPIFGPHFDVEHLVTFDVNYPRDVRADAATVS